MPSLTQSQLNALVRDYSEWSVFIESGTYRGDTVLNMEPHFDELHTIEIGQDLWKRARERYSGRKIEFHLGDSQSVLPKLLPRIRKRAIFFLDGHWSCGETSKGEIDVPLLNELRILMNSFNHEAVILIDDLRLFGSGPETSEPVDWTSISREAVREVLRDRCVSWVEDSETDKLIIRLRARSEVASHPIPITFGLNCFKNEEIELKNHRILVGVCSAKNHHALRQAARETWMSRTVYGIEVCFFVGDGDDCFLPEEPDTLALKSEDTYEALPSKVKAFFAHALKTKQFDWLFKCDDDTYLELKRLHSLISDDWDFVGNEFLAGRGTPSGGAGYLLSRKLIEAVVNDEAIPPRGAEDVLIGESAVRNGARIHATERLCWNKSRFPAIWNDTITSHWCQADQLRRIEEIRSIVPRMLDVQHSFWRDRLMFFPDGSFIRSSTACQGTYQEDGDGIIRLKWKDWEAEVLVPSLDLRSNFEGGSEKPTLPAYTCRKVVPRVLTVVLRGGLGNQMFQYAHALALSKRHALQFRVSYENFGRPFSLGLFDISIDPEIPGTSEMIEDNGTYLPDRNWLSDDAILRSSASQIRLAGYFQNENFFQPVADEIRASFRLQPRRFPHSADRTLVAVHVRRGDFLGTGHDLCRPRYFFQAIQMMRSLVQEPLFLVVSDDPAWCREIFQSIPDLIVAEYLPEQEALETLHGCDAFILSNSTFGWWAAWLADRYPVIAPNRFLNGRTWLICPDRWITMPPEGSEVNIPQAVEAFNQGTQAELAKP